MRNVTKRTILLALIVYSLLFPSFSIAKPPQALYWNLSFSDEFNGNTLDLTKWSTTYPDGRRTTSSNHELEWYVDDAFQLSNGMLKIVAKPQNVGNFHFTSGLITTYKSFSQQYGYYETRAKVPKGRGLWPAFWMLPAASGKWLPEIDILETFGLETNKAYQTYFYPQNGASKQLLSIYKGPDLSLDFHTYGVYWDRSTIRWYLDNLPIYEVKTQVSQVPMYILLNLAINSDGINNENLKSGTPAYYEIDYVRAYSLQAFTAPGK